MRLTYDKSTRSFYAHVSSMKSVKSFRDEPEWLLYKVGIYVTTSIKEAARFRRFADDKAEKFFNRAFVKTYELPSAPLPKFLDPWQREGVRWILTRERSYIAHAPGAGKSLDVIVASLYAEGDGQTFIIVPPTLTVNWENEIVKWLGVLKPDEWPSISVIPETSNQHFMGWGADYIIVPDSMITKPWVLTRLTSMRKKLVAVDEASRFKEPTSARTIALFGGHTKAFKSFGIIRGARHAVLLDGSPMPNRHMELWAPTYAMMPEAINFMSQKQFGFRYCGAQMNDYGKWEYKHASRPDELKEKLQAKFMHVVTEERLGHSKRLRSIVFLNEDNRTREHKEWERKFLTTFDPETQGEEESQGELAKRRKEYGLSIVKASARYIKERVDSGEAVLVFAWHREVIHALSKALVSIPHGVIMGGTPAHEREASIKFFKRGATNLMIMNIASGGRGLNGLQRAGRVIFPEPSWTDETNIQCEKRASRKGRNARLSVKSDYLAVRGSIVERMLSACFTKAKRVKRVIG